MGKSKIIPIIVVLAIAGVGVYLATSGGKVELTGNGVNVSKTTTTTEESFTGSLKAAVQKGVPMKCTMEKDSTTGTEVMAGYFHGEKYYGEVKTNGKEGYIVMKENCMWSWEKDQKQGIKMCFEENVWDQQDTSAASATSAGNYNCKVAVFSDSIFTVPSDVQFMDIDNLQQE
jgi:hypothetical protein